MVAGNKHGLLVPSQTTDEEISELREKLPSTVKVVKINEKLSALGNTIVCNDRVALIHPDIDADTELIISEVL